MRSRFGRRFDQCVLVAARARRFRQLVFPDAGEFGATRARPADLYLFALNIGVGFPDPLVHLVVTRSPDDAAGAARGTAPAELVDPQYAAGLLVADLERGNGIIRRAGLRVCCAALRFLA